MKLRTQQSGASELQKLADVAGLWDFFVEWGDERGQGCNKIVCFCGSFQKNLMTRF